MGFSFWGTFREGYSRLSSDGADHRRIYSFYILSIPYFFYSLREDLFFPLLNLHLVAFLRGCAGRCAWIDRLGVGAVKESDGIEKKLESHRLSSLVLLFRWNEQQAKLIFAWFNHRYTAYSMLNCYTEPISPLNCRTVKPVLNIHVKSFRCRPFR